MLISANWLKKYVPDLDLSNLDEFRYKLDTRLSEVAAITRHGEGLKKLVTAEILSAEPHPSSDKLHLCKVSIGNKAEPLQIVCGAPNARTGLVSILCVVGGKVYDHSTGELVEITKRTIRDVESNGMLCSPAELGLGANHNGIIELPSTTPIGEDVTEQFVDTIIEIQNKAFPHRPDVFSHQGIAREIAAIFKLNLNTPTPREEFIAKAEEELPLQVEVKDKEHCLRFTATSLTNVQITQSPLWLQIMLSYCGVRPINNVVDVTNYVMLDMGQPLHAFDYQKVDKAKLIVRQSEAGEKLTTLDGKARELPEGTVVVADASVPSSVAGIMGGAASEISDTTTQLILEAANWEMYQVRRTSRVLGLRTEASSRYEKGLTPEIVGKGLIAAANMLLDLAGAETASPLIDIYPDPQAEKFIDFDLHLIKDRLGIAITKNELIDILRPLGIVIVDSDQLPPEAMSRHDLDSGITLEIPPFRQDLNIQADILEEIGRFYGYENITPTLPKRDLQPAAVNLTVKKNLELKKLMAASGLNEIYTYSMVGEKLYKDCLLATRGLIKVKNPISPELAFVRDSVVPSLLEKAQANLAKFGSFGLFELSRVAYKHQEDGLPQQPFKLAGLFVHEDATTAYRSLKLAIDNLNTKLDGQLKIVPKADNRVPFLHPGKSGELELDGHNIGFIGVVHPVALQNMELGTTNVAVFEIDLTRVLEFEPEVKTFKPISRFPAVVRDISFWKPETKNIQDLIDELITAKVTDLEKVSVIDMYQKDEELSVTIRCVLQPQEATYTQEQINERVEKIVATAKAAGFKIRE